MNPTDFFSQPSPQGPVGRSPLRYLEELPDSHRPDSAALNLIPDRGKKPLTREQLCELCGKPNLQPLIAYACIMAWGGRDFGNYRQSLADGGTAIILLIEALRSSTATRGRDFASTQKAARSIRGLGISFYTKLLFFLRTQSDAYILDQWTAKSAVVLFPESGVRLSPAGLPDPETSAETYDAFCKQLEACCGTESWGEAWRTGEEVERALFDRPGGPWRTWLKAFIGEEISPRGRSRKPTGGDNNGTRAVRSLANSLKASYLHALDGGLSLPEGCGGFAQPNRLHVRAQRGFQFQFIINKMQIRAQLFLSGSAVAYYEALIERLRPKTDGHCHDFGHGITGNGPRRKTKTGVTRAIDLPTINSGGWASPEVDWAPICESAVESMACLFQFLEPHLPANSKP